MTSINALVAELEAQGLRPLVRGAKLKLAGPKSKLTADLIERVRVHKSELIDLFAPAAPHAARASNDKQQDGARAPFEGLQVEEPAAPITPWRDDPTIPVQLAEELRRWEPQLKAMSWSEERIWRRSFWPHSAEHPRGLASILDAGDRIIFADDSHVWIIRRDGMQQKFPKDAAP